MKSRRAHARFDWKRPGKPFSKKIRSLADADNFPFLLDLVRLRTSQIHQHSFCVEKHLFDLRAHGESEERLRQLNSWRESLLFSAREQAALALSEAITMSPAKPLSASFLQKARRYFNQKEMMTLVLAILAVNDWVYR